VNGRLYEALWLTQELPDILNLNYYVSGSGYLAATIATAATIPHRPADVGGGEWVASHSVGGRKQRRGWCGSGSGNYTRAVRWRLYDMVVWEWRRRGNSGAHGAEAGLHYRSKSSSVRRVIQT